MGLAIFPPDVVGCKLVCLRTISTRRCTNLQAAQSVKKISASLGRCKCFCKLQEFSFDILYVRQCITIMYYKQNYWKQEKRKTTILPNGGIVVFGLQFIWLEVRTRYIFALRLKGSPKNIALGEIDVRQFDCRLHNDET